MYLPHESINPKIKVFNCFYQLLLFSYDDSPGSVRNDRLANVLLSFDIY